ncbi:hypothetical protein [Variovorax sp. PBS-H4]|uniref:hypothetical protein n=1 Tax=Variovorax sp. PBS-H4 TaxID=434008 RepID=UPI0013A53A17|nr:hypothetical protein [Variovorax sp. PBS-H4]
MTMPVLVHAVDPLGHAFEHSFPDSPFNRIPAGDHKVLVPKLIPTQILVEVTCRWVQLLGDDFERLKHGPNGWLRVWGMTVEVLKRSLIAAPSNGQHRVVKDGQCRGPHPLEHLIDRIVNDTLFVNAEANVLLCKSTFHESAVNLGTPSASLSLQNLERDSDRG